MDEFLNKILVIYNEYINDGYLYYSVYNHIIIIEKKTLQIKIIFNKFNPTEVLTYMGDHNNQILRTNDILKNNDKCNETISEAFNVNTDYNLLKIRWYMNGHIKHTQILTNPNSILHTYWYENGIKEKEFLYVNNKLEGLAKNWYSNGNLEKEINYVNDHPEGSFKIFKLNGDILIEKILKYDKVFGINYCPDQKCDLLY